MGESIGNYVNYGVMGYAASGNYTNTNVSIGGFFRTQGYANSSYGVKAKANGVGVNFGVYSWASSMNSQVAYSIYGQATANTGSTSQTVLEWAGYFDGNVNVVGGQYFPSKTDLKDNIEPISNALNTLNQIETVSFNFRNEDYPSMALPVGLEYGVIAENINTVLPDLVKNVRHPEQIDSLGNVVTPAVDYLGVNYIELIPVLIAGVKELNSLNADKDSLINNLEARLLAIEVCLSRTGICNDNENKTGVNDLEGRVLSPSIELSNLNAIILDQNVPNPFAEKTIVNYSLPEDVLEAQLIFSDMDGKVIKQVTIDERGDGALTVYGENLKSGIYIYSLIADGKLIATKRMVKTN